MAITKTNRLNMTGSGIPLIIRLSQYDEDFTLVFELYSSDGTFTIPSGTTAEVRGTKSDGKGYSASATLDITNKKVTVAGEQQMTAVSGKNIFELTLWKSNKELNTANFILDIEPAALDRNTIVSESKIMELLDVTDRADEIIDAAETIESSAAQIAKNTQDIVIINEEITRIGSGFPDDAKIALLNCFAHVVWIDEHGQDYYDALEAALYAGTYPKITAVFDAGLNVIYTDDALDTLKQYLTVKYYETEESSGVTVPSTDYTLYGTLVEGSNTLRATYEGLSAPFVVNGVVDYYNIYDWSTEVGSLNFVKAGVVAGEGSYAGNISYSGYGMTSDGIRRTIGTLKGKKKITIQNQSTESPYYPIPVPDNAIKVMVSITPNTMYISPRIFRLSNNMYTSFWIKSWQPGQISEDLSDIGADDYLVVNIKNDNAGSTFTNEPTALSVMFE